MTPACCPTCGRPAAPLPYRRGDWIITYEPTIVYWRWQQIHVSAGAETAALSTIVHNEYAPHVVLEAVALGPDASPSAMKKIICNVRKALNDVHPHLGRCIVNWHRHGYLLDMDGLREPLSRVSRYAPGPFVKTPRGGEQGRSVTK